MKLKTILFGLIGVLIFSGASFAQETSGASGATAALDGLTSSIPGADSPGRLSSALEIAIVLSVISLLPPLLMTVTSFMRIIIVFSFVRRAMGTPELPPNQVLTGLAFFLTLFIMYPVASKIYDRAVQPYLDGKISVKAAADEASTELKGFLLKQTRESDLSLFVQVAKVERPQTPQDLSLRIVVPAYILSELKTAFQMGFVLFLPFLVIDLVISSILLSMGMFMLPPVVISTPFKILLFVLVDGWNLLIRSLVTSFAT